MNKIVRGKPIRQGLGETPNDWPLISVLKESIQKWVQDNQGKQSALAFNCGIDPADLVHFLKLDRPWPLYALANLAIELHIDPAKLLLEWEQYQCQKKRQEVTGRESKKHAGWKIASDVFGSLLEHLPNDESVQIPQSQPGTLVDWPRAFLPLIVFVGDRRELPPKSPADLLAASASMGDLYYLPRLRLPFDTEIRSDKTCVIASPDSLRQLVEERWVG